MDCYEFPVFKGSISDAKAAEVTSTAKATSDAAAAAAAAEPEHVGGRQRKDSTTLMSAMSNLSLALSLGKK